MECYPQNCIPLQVRTHMTRKEFLSALESEISDDDEFSALLYHIAKHDVFMFLV
jgi:hypothetical protein